MNLSTFKMFCDVVEMGSITQAAHRGYVSQPAVTKQMHHLEELYGTELFDRSDNKMTLTKAGEVLYPFAKDMVAHFQHSIEAVKEIMGLEEGKLLVGASLTIGEYMLPRLFERYIRKQEEMTFSLVLSNTPDILDKLKTYEVDLALVEGILETDKKDPDVIVEKFAEDELILITPNNAEWRTKDVITLDDLHFEKMIWREPSSGTRVLVEKVLKERGVLQNIKGAMELGSLQAIKSAVEAGLGVSILPKLTVRNELEFGLLREVGIQDLHLTRSLYLVRKKTRFRKKVMDDFADFIKNEEMK